MSVFLASFLFSMTVKNSRTDRERAILDVSTCLRYTRGFANNKVAFFAATRSTNTRSRARTHVRTACACINHHREEDEEINSVRVCVCVCERSSFEIYVSSSRARPTAAIPSAAATTFRALTLAGKSSPYISSGSRIRSSNLSYQPASLLSSLSSPLFSFGGRCES